MDSTTLALPSHFPAMRIPRDRRLFFPPQFSPSSLSYSCSCSSLSPSTVIMSFGVCNRRYFRTACVGSPEQDIADEPNRAIENDEDVVSVASVQLETMEDVHSIAAEDFGADKSIWTQLKEIAMFAGPATGLWICGPLMSLIDTAVIGQGSSMELAAFGTLTCWQGS